MTSLPDTDLTAVWTMKHYKPPPSGSTLFPALRMHLPRGGFPTCPGKLLLSRLPWGNMVSWLSSLLMRPPHSAPRQPMASITAWTPRILKFILWAPCPASCSRANRGPAVLAVPRTSQACHIQDQPSSQPPKPGAPLEFVVSPEAPRPLAGCLLLPPQRALFCTLLVALHSFILCTLPAHWSSPPG